MNEAEWLACNNPTQMLDFVANAATHWRTRWVGRISTRRFNVSERKRRLIACAVVRRVAPLWPADAVRHLLDVFERFADGQADRGELDAAATASERACATAHFPERLRGFQFDRVALGTLGYFNRGGEGQVPIFAAAHAWAEAAAYDAIWERRNLWSKEEGSKKDRQRIGPIVDGVIEMETIRARELAAESARQADLVRDVLGNLYRSVTVDAAWLAWQGGTVGNLARSIYDEKRFGDLPILADALEEAGCDDTAILEHCRRGSDHVRGCWVVDLILGNG